MLVRDNLQGYVIKYNVTERLFYSPFSDLPITKIYDYEQYKKNNESIRMMKCLILQDKNVYIPMNEGFSKGVSLMDNRKYIQSN